MFDTEPDTTWSRNVSFPSGSLAELTGRKQRDLYHHLDTLEETALVRKRTRDGSRFYELSALGDRLVEPLFETLRERAAERGQ